MLLSDSTSSSPYRRSAVLLCSIYKSNHGGSLYFQQLARVLNGEGWKLGLMSEDEVADKSLHWQMRLPDFFRSGLRALPARAINLIQIIERLVHERPQLLIVQGDLPRVSYLFLQLWVPLMFIRQDSILTCPANDRFLPLSRTVCRKPAGFSCLGVDQKEGCLNGMSEFKKRGRIVYRLRDLWLLRLLKNFIGNSQHILRIHHRVDGGVIYPPSPEARADQDAQRNLHTVIFCGRLERVKGAEEAIFILSLLAENYRLQILGEGGMRADLESLCEKLGVKGRVEFCGWVDPSERDKRLEKAAVLVVPSLWDEAFGMTGVEAFAVGTPVVAYRVGGIGEWCHASGGRLVECGDRKGAAEAILELTSSLAHWQRSSLAARAYASVNYGPAVFRREVLSAVTACLRE